MAHALTSERAFGTHAARVAAFAVALGIGAAGIHFETRWRRPAASEPARWSGASVAGPMAAPAPLSPPPAPTPAAEAPAIPRDTSAPAAASDAPFLGDESALLEGLRAQPVVRVKKGSGGRTLAFKLTLADGTQAYFKPEQSVSSAHWYAEVAAYHLDRALRLGRVPPVVSRKLPWSLLARAAADDPRVPEIVRDAEGNVRGALVHWLEPRLAPAPTPPGWESWVRVEPFARTAASPYQRPAVYAHQLATLRALARGGKPAPARYAEVPAQPDARLAPALADMIVFDFLTLNYDRFGNDNTNVLTLGTNGPLIFLDNGDGFSEGPPRRSLCDARLAPLQRFRERTIAALRELDFPALAARLKADPLGPLLDDRALDGLQRRREAVIEHVAAQAARFGDTIYTF